ncbi:MAG: helix-turn-helix transcriptional regulator [Pseudonocardiales bacterium]|nr:helix-turn-helix transcriptional regulator [Pseudonocardiales bacterium]
MEAIELARRSATTLAQVRGGARRVVLRHLLAEVLGPGVAPRGVGEEPADERALVDADDARTIGWRLRQVRRSRDKSLRVVAGLAGMSKSHLSEIERGDCALDSLSEILALAEVLQIAPSELIRLPVPAPGNGATDAAINAVRLALLAVSRDRPGGQVLSVEALRGRVASALDAYWRCDPDYGGIGAALSGLIRDLHMSIAVGRDAAELLDLAVLLHSHATIGWLRRVGAAVDLRAQAAELARRTAQERDTPDARGLAVWGGLYVLVMTGAAELAWAELDSVTVPTNSPESMQVAGELALCRSFLAAVDSRPGDVGAPLELATELAQRTGEVNAYGLGFGPQEIGQWRARAALEIQDYEQAVRVAEGLRPETHPLRTRQADYWLTYGRALARLRGRRDDAVMALRRAELILPHYVQRDPIVRDVLAELLVHGRRDAGGRELRGMAYRAGLPV